MRPPFLRRLLWLAITSWILAPVAATSAADAPTAPAAGELPAVQVVDSAEQPSGTLPLDQPVETGSRLGLTPRETPASVTVIDRDTLDARGVRTTQEALRGVPGVIAHDAPGNIGVQYRGFSGSSITQLFNGINVQYSIAARPVDSWIHDRVEAIGGPSSFLNGAGAVGGTLNYITKLPVRESLSEAQLRVGSHGLRQGSVGLNRRIAGDGSGNNDHHLRIDANQSHGGAWTEGTKRDATQVAVSLLSDLGHGLSHTLAYEYQKEWVDRPYWGTPLLNPRVKRPVNTARIDPGTRLKNYNSTDGIYAQRVQWLRSVTEWRASDALQLRNTFYVYDALRDYRNVEVYRFNASNTAVTRTNTFLQRHDQRLVGNRIDGTYRGQIAGRRSDWAFGVDFSQNEQTRFPNSVSGTVSTVNPYAFVTEPFFGIRGMIPGFRPDRTNRLRTMAVFAENRTALTPALSLVTALRHERIDLRLHNKREVSASSPLHYARDYKPTTGRIGLVWDFAPGANLYAQCATAADPPGGVLSTASFAQLRDNSELSTGRQIEVGSKLDFWQGKGTATVAAYRITRRNIATQDPNNSQLTIQVGEQSTRGVEVAVGLQPTREWAIQVNASYVEARYDNFRQGGISYAGNTPTNTPRTVLNLWTSYAITPQLQASVGVRRVGAVYADAANTTRWPAYTLVDLGLSYQINRNATLTARIRNASDRVYALNVDTMAYLGEPRTGELSLRVGF